MKNYILSIIIRILHTLYIIFSIFGPYLFNDIKILCLLIFFYIATITQWYLFNSCLLTDIEYSLSDQNITKYKDGSSKSFIVNFLEKKLNINEKILYYIFTFIPVFNAFVCLIKILYLYNKCTSKIKKDKLIYLK